MEIGSESQFAPPRPYGQSVPIEYVDAFLHGESLVSPNTARLIDEPVFDGDPPAAYLEKIRNQEKED